MTVPAEEAKVPLVTPEMRGQIGIEGPPTIYEVDKTMIRMFARATGYTDPIFYDEARARAAGYRSLPCPPGFMGTPIFDPEGPPFNPTAMSGPQPSRPLTRILDGGSEIEYLSYICAGDVLEARSHVAALDETRSSVGEMLIVTTTTIFRRDGEPVAISTHKLIRY